MKLKMNMSCSSLSEKRETVRFQQILVVSCTVFFAVCSNSLYAAANHYIRDGASGADTGSNWTDAWNELPASLTRGDTYYIADGSYTGYTFDDEESGSTYITIKKATAEDHGDPCGWNSSYGDGVAEWVLDNTNSSLHFQTGYYVFDGVVGGGPRNWDGGSTSHGFKIYPDSGADTTNFHLIEIHNGSNPNVEHPDYIEIKHCEITSPYRQSGDAGGYIGDHDYAIFQSLSWWYWTGAGDRDQNQGPRNVTISYNYIHDVYQHLYSTHTQDWIIEYNYMARNDVDWIGGRPSNQGTGIFDYGSDNWIIRYNIFEDMSGTGFIDVKKNANHDNDNWAIYGNVFWYTPGYNYAGGLGNGVIVIGGFNCTEETPCATTNMKVYNNAFVNLRGGSVGVFLESYPSTNNWVYNNIFFDTERNWNGMFWSCEHSHNSFISNTGGWSDATIAASEPGTGYAGTDDPFTDWVNMDFTLKSATTAGNTLASPYNQDWTGVTRGADGLWDRGAYEYSSSTADIAIDDSITINEDSGLNTIDVLDNDLGEGLTITSVTQGDNGSVSHDGIRVAYEPEQDFFGTDTFIYTVTDGSGFDIGHVTVTVLNVNDEPEATDDSAVISKNSTAYTIDVLANDSDPDGPKPFIKDASHGNHGTVGIISGRTELTYTPDTDFVGSDTFTYTIEDYAGSTDTATVSVTVTNFDGSDLVGYWTLDETTGTVAADSSGNGNNATLINGPIWTTGKISGALDLDGVDDYVDCGNDQSLDLIEDLSIGLWFYAREWNNNSWPALISKRDSYTSMNWELFYYRDLNSIQFWYGNEAAYKLFGDLNVSPSLESWHQIFVTRQGDTWTLYLDGVSQGTNTESGPMPTGDSLRVGVLQQGHGPFAGTIDDVRIYNRALIADEIQELYSAGTSANNPPTANNDSVIVNKDSTANVIDVLSNDTDADGDTLLIVQPVGQGSYGTVAIIGGGTGLTYTPDENYSGDDTFTYTVSDGNGGTDTATVNVSISDSNVNGLVGFWEFEEGSGLTTADSSGNGNTGTLANELMWTGFGELNFDGVDDYVDCGNDPSLNLTSNLTIAAWINPISFGQGGYGRIVDKGSSSTGFSFFLNEANNGLGYVIYGGTLVWSDASVIALNQQQYVAVVYNGFSSTITFYVDGLPVGSSNYQTNPIDSSNDPLFIGIRGYDLNRAFDGLIDDVRVYNRALSSTEIQQLYSDRPSANNPPTAGNDSATVDEDSVANVINVLANDTDADDDTLIITSVTQATHGSVAITGGGTGLAYTPTPDYNGPDSFTYTISDGQGGIDTATVSVTVTNVPDDPEAEDDSAVTDEDTDVTTGNVLTNDTDADGDTLTIDSFTQVIHGTVAYNNDGTFTYTPAANYNGNDSFDYTISDGNGGTDTATVLIDVTAINDPPDVSAIPDTLQKYEDESILPQEIELATDVDSSDTLTYTYLPDLQANDYILHVDVSDGTVTVRKDVTIIVIPVLPTVISATAATKFTVEVVFSEDLEKSSAENIDNYSIENDSLINPIVINLLELNAEGDTVTLHTTGHTETEGVFYNLTVANVQDLAENTMIGETKDYTFDDGLIGLWRFNDQAGNTAQDSSGYDNTATLVNGPVWSEQDDLNFDGTDDAVEIPTANWNVNNGTIALWAYAEDLAGIRYLFGHITDSGNDRIGLYTDEGNLNLELGDSGVVSENIENLDLQTWYHFALTWDGTNYIVYVNGGEEAWGTFSGLTDLNNFADIGNTGQISYRDNAFAGYIDDARVYNRALSSDEVINVYLMSDESIRENKVLAFGVSATYPDGSALIYSETDPNLLVIDEASFNEKGTGTFAWNPWYDQAGTYDITFLPTDQQQPQYSQTVTVFVEDVQLSGWYQRWLEHLGLL